MGDGSCGPDLECDRDFSTVSILRDGVRRPSDTFPGRTDNAALTARMNACPDTNCTCTDAEYSTAGDRHDIAIPFGPERFV